MVGFSPPGIDLWAYFCAYRTGKIRGGSYVFRKITHRLAGIPNPINADMDCGNGGFALPCPHSGAQSNIFFEPSHPQWLSLGGALSAHGRGKTGAAQ